MRRASRCEVCGVTLPQGAGRCPTCGHEVGTSVVVASGGPSKPARAKGRHVGLVVLAAAGLGVAVLAVVDRSAEPSTERPDGGDQTAPTLGSGSTLADAGPPATLPGSTGLRVVAFQPTGVEVADLDTGDRAVMAGIGDSTFLGGVARAGGVVTIMDDQVVFVPDVEPGGPLIRLGTGYGVLASDQPDRVWVLAGSPITGANTVLEIDLGGRITGETTDLPSVVTPVGPVAGGLVLASPDGVFLLDREGNARRVADGSAVGAFGSSIVHRACEADLRCSLYVTDVATGDRRRVTGGGEVPANPFAEQGVSPDGRLMFSFSYAEAGTAVSVLDLEAGEVAYAGGPELIGHAAGAVWSPDGRWLFWLATGAGGVGALRSDDWRFFELDIPGGYGLVVLGAE